MTPSFPAEAKSAPEGWLEGTRHNALTTSVLPLMVCENLPLVSKTLMSLSAQPVQSIQYASSFMRLGYDTPVIIVFLS